MELGTFGAIVRFAIELEGQAAAFYETTARGEFAEPFRQLGQGSRRRLQRLERARREGVAEMILESIRGLDGDHYRLDPVLATDEADLRRQAIALEETMARFYRDAAAKMPIPEIGRLFRQLAAENEKRQAEIGNPPRPCGAVCSQDGEERVRD